MLIAIDGPAGSGKTTVSRLLAKKINFFYLDTGAMYRTLTLKCIRDDIDLNDEKAVSYAAQNLSLKMEDDRMYLDGEDVTEEIRKPYINDVISRIAANPGARKVMVEIQRTIASNRDCVVEGRDITTVVFPGAEYRFYLDADIEERIGRRHQELQQKGIVLSREELSESVKKRDHADMNREVGALKKTEGVTYIDTTSLSIEQVVEKLASYITQK
ncbi:MAG: (d)CMP kinase [Candidatus Omnitrophica bacterium]|nr:(d)CMP kinase [Candidatus Omnitrophota bacterium]